MAIKLNGTDITVNRIDTLNITEEKLDNNKVYPDIMTMGVKINSSLQTVNLAPSLINGRKCVIITFNDPVLSISGVEGGNINTYPGNTVEIVNDGFFTGSYALDMSMQDITGNLMMFNFEIAVNTTNAYVSNLSAYMPDDIYALMITVD